MRLTSDKRIEAWDRRKTAIHEAGHFIMAQHLEANPHWAYIKRCDIQDLRFEKRWIGSTRWGHYDGRKMGVQVTRLIAVAGAVAEDVWMGGDFDLNCWYDENAMSDTDWAGAGCEPGNPTRAAVNAIEKAYRLFEPSGKLWPLVIAKSRELIVDSRDAVDSATYLAELLRARA